MAKRKKGIHFENDLERIAELKLALQTVFDLVQNSPKERLEASAFQCRSLARAVLTWFDQDKKYLTQNVDTVVLGSGSITVKIVE